MNIQAPNEVAPPPTAFADKVALELTRRTGSGVSVSVSRAKRERWRTLVITAA